MKRVLWSVYHPVVDKVEWCQKGTRRLTFEQGTYRFPLHIPFPQTNIPPSISRYSLPLSCVRVVSCHAQEGAYRISPRLLTRSADGLPSVCKPTQFFCSYGVRGILTYPWPYVDFWTSLSPFPLTVVSHPLQRRQLMVHLSQPRLHTTTFTFSLSTLLVLTCFLLVQTSAQQTTFSATCSRLRGIRLSISLPKTGYYLGEKVPPLPSSASIDAHVPHANVWISDTDGRDG